MTRALTGLDREFLARRAEILEPALVPVFDERFLGSAYEYDEFVYRLALGVFRESGLEPHAREARTTEELAARARNLGYREVLVLPPWESHRIKDVTITAVPGLHDIYEIGYVVQGGGTSMYFAGDSRLHPALPAIAERFAPEVSILSCDGTRLAGGDLHVMTPEDAVTAARTLRSKLVLPSHAEAVFSDPLAAHVLASTVARARFVFGEQMARALPGVRCVVPAAGELVAV